MGKEVRIFDLQTKKQSLNVFKSQKRKNKLAEELNKVIAYQKQLLEIMQSIDKEASQKTVSELKSENWYNLKIQDELIGIKNKIEFLSLELKNQNMQVALASEKRKKFQEKKRHFNKLEQQEKETRQESALQSTIINSPKP